MDVYAWATRLYARCRVLSVNTNNRDVFFSRYNQSYESVEVIKLLSEHTWQSKVWLFSVAACFWACWLCPSSVSASNTMHWKPIWLLNPLERVPAKLTLPVCSGSVGSKHKSVWLSEVASWGGLNFCPWCGQPPNTSGRFFLLYGIWHAWWRPIPSQAAPFISRRHLWLP